MFKIGEKVLVIFENFRDFGTVENSIKIETGEITHYVKIDDSFGVVCRENELIRLDVNK